MYWDCPPSSLMGEWGKSLVELAKAKRLNRRQDDDGGGDVDGVGGDSIGDIGEPPPPPLLSSRWARQDSHTSNASTSTNASSNTTASSSAASTRRRAVKSLRRLNKASPTGGFRRHASSYAALGTTAPSTQEGMSVDGDGGGVSRGGAMQRLLADLSIRVQEIDREVDGMDEMESGEAAADVTIGGASSSTTTATATATPAKTATKSSLPSQASSSSQTPRSQQPPRSSANWERSVTFPPSGSPVVTRVEISNREAGAADDGDEDSFDDLDFDEDFLRDIEKQQAEAEAEASQASARVTSQAGDVEVVAAAAAATAASSPPPPRPSPPRQRQLGKRRCPPSPIEPSPTASIASFHGKTEVKPAGKRHVSVGRFVGSDSSDDDDSDSDGDGDGDNRDGSGGGGGGGVGGRGRNTSLPAGRQTRAATKSPGKATAPPPPLTVTETHYSRGTTSAANAAIAVRPSHPVAGAATSAAAAASSPSPPPPPARHASRLGTRATSHGGGGQHINNNIRAGSTGLSTRTRSAGLPRQRFPLEQHQQQPTTTATTKVRNTYLPPPPPPSSAFKPPTRVAIPLATTLASKAATLPATSQDTDFDAMLDDDDDPELERALAAAGY